MIISEMNTQVYARFNHLNTSIQIIDNFLLHRIDLITSRLKKYDLFDLLIVYNVDTL